MRRVSPRGIRLSIQNMYDMSTYDEEARATEPCLNDPRRGTVSANLALLMGIRSAVAVAKSTHANASNADAVTVFMVTGGIVAGGGSYGMEQWC